MSDKRIAIVQSNYIPWKGYFDLIAAVDEFIVFDDMQYTRRSWRNRNVIKSQHGLRWLTIPIANKGNYYQRIRDARIADPRWQQDHLEAIRHSYARAPYFREYFPWLQELYASCDTTYLSELNTLILRGFCQLLGLHTTLTSSADYDLSAGRTERLLHLCHQAEATAYLSGPSAREYLDDRLFAEAGVRLDFIDYDGYLDYGQPHPPFEHRVSIVDLILCTGPQAASYLKFVTTHERSL